MPSVISTDALIVGAGVAGLWLNARLRRQGFSTVVVESATLGGGQSDLAAPTEPIGLSLRQRVLRGALTNATNPKGIVFMVAVLPQFIDPKKPLALQLAILLVTTLAVDSVVMHGYAFLASRLRALMQSVRARRAQNRVFGGVLMGMGASLLMVDRAVKAG